MPIRRGFQRQDVRQRPDSTNGQAEQLERPSSDEGRKAQAEKLASAVPAPTSTPASPVSPVSPASPASPKPPAPLLQQPPLSPPASTSVMGRVTLTPEEREMVLKLRARVHQRVISDMDKMGIGLEEHGRPEVANEFIERAIRETAEEERMPLSVRVRTTLVQEVLDEILGYGPIQPLLDEPSITEVLVNNPRDVFYEREGRIYRSDRVFDSAAHVLRIIDKIVSPLGRQINERIPYVDARLPDGSRVNAIIPPLAVDGPCLTIRKFFKRMLTVHDLIEYGTLTEEMAMFLEACVKARLNILVSGGTGTGKTTTLNVLSHFIPEHERVITVEDAAELQLDHEDKVRLEARPRNIEGLGEVTIRDLVANSLRMRPDRIVVGECRRGEALDMLQAMNTGHDGSLSTIHSNSPRDTIARLVTMVQMAGMDLPVSAIVKQIASAIQIIVHQARLYDGSRKITHITEVQGLEGDTVLLQDLFIFEQKGIDENGKVIGRHRSCGFRPLNMEKIIAAGIKLPDGIFFTKEQTFRQTPVWR